MSLRIAFDDVSESESLDSPSSQSEPGRVSSDRGGLQAINDFDFETLIELLGTTGNVGNDNSKCLGGLAMKGNMKRQSRLLSNSKTAQIVDAISSTVRTPGKIIEELSDDEEQTSNEIEALKSPAFIAAQEASIRMSPLQLQSPDRSSKSKRLHSTQDISNSTPSKDSRKKQGVKAENEHVGSIESSESMARPSPSRPQGSATPNKLRSALSPSSIHFAGLTRELSASLGEAQQQAIDLRTRIQQLKEGVKEFAPHLYHKAFEQAPDSSNDLERDRTLEGSFSMNLSGLGPRLSSSSSMENSGEQIDVVVSQLSNDDARNALNNACRALRIHPRKLLSFTPEILDYDPPQNLSDVSRALRLVSDLDELVWRRANRRPTKPKVRFDEDSSNVYSQENLDSIMGRVCLWERISRAQSDRPSRT